MTATPTPPTPDAPPADPSGSTSASATPQSRGPVARAVLWAGAALLAIVLVWFGALTARGGHIFVVQTPSMARTAPVGSLVVTEKVDPSTLGKGDIITFRPPRIERTYTHRIVEVTPQGFRTKGDLNSAPDGWVVPRDRVVGKAVHLWFGLGWLLRMTPWLVLGGLLTALARGVAKPHNRTIVEITGSALATAVAMIAVRPLVRAETIGFVPAGEDGVKISAVSTGLLPIRVSAKDGKYADLVAGQLGWIETHAADAKGRFQVIPELHLSWWGWVLFVLFCAGPFLASLFVKDTRPEPADSTGPTDPPAAPPSSAPRWRRVLRPAAAVGTTVAMAAALSPTQSALTAQISNSTNTAKTRASFYNTCLDAMRAYTSSQTTHNGRLGGGWTLGDGTGVAGTSSQATYYTGPVTFTNVTVVAPAAASDTGCQTDHASRGQGYVRLNGTSSKIDIELKNNPTSYTSSSPDPMADSNKITFVVWFRAVSTSKGGMLACLAQSGGTCMDRSLYIGADGKLNFTVGTPGLLTGPYYNLQTPASVLDGKWHMAAAQLDTVVGRTLWLDGAVVASDSRTAGQARTVYAQYGYSAGALLTDMPDRPASNYFDGDMEFASIYGPNSGGTQLKTSDVVSLYYSAFP